MDKNQHFITPRKAALGLGATGRGTENHWIMTMSAVALAILTPLVIYTVGAPIGASHAAVVGWFGHPLVAVIVGLFLVIGMRHWIRGTAILIDDYLRGTARTWALILSQVFGWGVIALGIVALARLALFGIVV